MLCYGVMRRKLNRVGIQAHPYKLHSKGGALPLLVGGKRTFTWTSRGYFATGPRGFTSSNNNEVKKVELLSVKSSDVVKSFQSYRWLDEMRFYAKGELCKKSPLFTTNGFMARRCTWHCVGQGSVG